MLPTFHHTITVLNRRAGSDSPDRLDLWKATVIENCSWAQYTTRAVSGNDITLEASHVVRVPQSSQYRPYSAWKADMEGFTFCVGDYIIKGEIIDEVTPETIQNIVNSCRPDAFVVKFFRDNTGIANALGHYHLEGL